MIINGVEPGLNPRCCLGWHARFDTAAGRWENNYEHRMIACVFPWEEPDIPSALAVQHQSVFQRFRPYAGPAQPGFEIDFLGCRTRHEFLPASLHTRTVTASYPPADEEYPEWVDVLESVAEARDRFVMIELGAGFGRWLVRAAKALAQTGIVPLHLVAVEPEPQHFDWLAQHFRDNDIDPRQHTLLQAAVSDHAGEAMLYVATNQDSTPAEWYGQSLVRKHDTAAATDTYIARPAIRHRSGWTSIPVSCVTLAQILAPLETVDLVDIDVQGEELKVLAPAVEKATRKVKRLHIGTHSREIELGLRKLLRAAGWKPIWDFRFGTTERTPWGKIRFTDGVHSWLNSRLVTKALG